MQFVVQMAGEAGSGKSTLAREIGRATGAVVLDKDVIKSAALGAGAEESLAGPLSFEVLLDLARSLLGMGHSVVLDSAAFFPRIVETGRSVAAAAAARYVLIECVCPDGDEHARRLASREGLPSQPRALEADRYERPGAARLAEERLVVDTREPVEALLARALAYLGLAEGPARPAGTLTP